MAFAPEDNAVHVGGRRGAVRRPVIDLETSFVFGKTAEITSHVRFPIHIVDNTRRISRGM